MHKNNEYQKIFKDKMKKLGFVRYELWVKPSWKPIIKKLLESLK